MRFTAGCEPTYPDSECIGIWLAVLIEVVSVEVVVVVVEGGVVVVVHHDLHRDCVHEGMFQWVVG